MGLYILTFTGFYHSGFSHSLYKKYSLTLITKTPHSFKNHQLSILTPNLGCITSSFLYFFNLHISFIGVSLSLHVMNIHEY